MRNVSAARTVAIPLCGQRKKPDWLGASAHAHEGETFSAYGFLLPVMTVASGAAESFSQPNYSAYTAAANPVLAVARSPEGPAPG